MKKYTIEFGILFGLMLIVSGCNGLGNNGGSASSEFERVNDGLVMEFVKNYPGDRYLISDIDGEEEEVSIIIDLRNRGTFPEGDNFDAGGIYLSGFDRDIVNMDTYVKDLSDEDVFLPAASYVNPLGSFSTAEFEGDIIGDNIPVETYTPTILATACYPYATKASPTVCVDPFPFDDRQEKVCTIGSQTLGSQGAPVAVTRIDQEASTGKVQFKIHMKNLGGGDIIKPGKGKEATTTDTLDLCSPLGNDLLDRKDFDRVHLKTVEIGGNNLVEQGKCSPFADGTSDDAKKIIRLFEGEGFVICTLTVADLGTVQSAYTTPLNIELGYNYRSTISKQIEISKLKTVNS
jgi:hypothetical protein